MRPIIGPTLKDDAMDIGNLAVAQEDILWVIPMEGLIATVVDNLQS